MDYSNVSKQPHSPCYVDIFAHHHEPQFSRLKSSTIKYKLNTVYSHHLI